MASFLGHAIPGSFFLLFGLWLTIKHTLQHYWRKNQPRGRAILPPFFKRIEYIEGGLQIFASFVGIMVEQFVVDGPHAHLYDNNAWVKLMNWQHSTMYLFFGISGIALVLSTFSKLVPVGVDRLALSLALFVEGFLFYYHVSTRPLLDAHIHTLLLVAVFSGSACAMMEVFLRDHIILELLKACLFVLQGSWFYQIAFVLFPPRGPKWDLTLHSNVMFVTMCFCWHMAMALLVVTFTSAAVWITMRKFSRREHDMEMVMRSKLSAANSEKALLDESEED